MRDTNNFRKRSPEVQGSTVDPRTRFPKQAARLLREVPIAKVIGEYTKLHGSRKRLAADCPLHETPSRMLRVYPQTNTFRCLFCGIEGDALDFLQTVVELTYGQAIEELERIQYANEYRDAG
jgi:DNA primase